MLGTCLFSWITKVTIETGYGKTMCKPFKQKKKPAAIKCGRKALDIF